MDLREADAQSAAKDLEEWFGESVMRHHPSNLYPTGMLTTLTKVEHGEAEPGEIKAKGYGCDVSNEQSVAATFEKIEQDYGKRIDVSLMLLGHHKILHADLLS